MERARKCGEKVEEADRKKSSLMMKFTNYKEIRTSDPPSSSHDPSDNGNNHDAEDHKILRKHSAFPFSQKGEERTSSLSASLVPEHTPIITSTSKTTTSISITSSHNNDINATSVLDSLFKKGMNPMYVDPPFQQDSLRPHMVNRSGEHDDEEKKKHKSFTSPDVIGILRLENRAGRNLDSTTRNSNNSNIPSTGWRRSSDGGREKEMHRKGGLGEEKARTHHVVVVRGGGGEVHPILQGTSCTRVEGVTSPEQSTAAVSSFRPSPGDRHLHHYHHHLHPFCCPPQRWT